MAWCSQAQLRCRAAAAHGVLAADGRQAQFHLHLEGAQQCAERLAPSVGIGGHTLEVFLVGEAHMGRVRTGAGHLGAGLHHGIGCAVVGAPGGELRMIAVGHHAGGVGDARHGQFLHGNLRGRGLAAAAVRHQHRAAADGRVEHLHQALLGGHVGRGHHRLHLLLEGLPCRLAEEGIGIRHRGDGRLGVMPGARAVDEAAGQVRHQFSVGHVGDLDVICRAKSHEGILVGRVHHHGHTLLGFADGEFRGI